MKQTLYIINPAGNGGAGTKAWEDFQAVWPEPIDPSQVVFTEHPGHARAIAATPKRYDTLAAVGGDGTVGEVISGIMESSAWKVVTKLFVHECHPTVLGNAK